MILVQEWIHKLEVAGGLRHLKWVLGSLALVVLVVGYDWRAFKNMSSQEAMDSAQLARNIAEGKGYTTLFVRPLSMYLLKSTRQEKEGVPAPGKLPEYTQIRERHPDISNPPVYPIVLAGWMKVYPGLLKAAEAVRGILPESIRDRVPRFDDAPDNPLWQRSGHFWRAPHDFLISLFNQLLFFALIVVVFFLARRLFDARVAWLSAILLLGSDLFWRFSVSGLSTMLLLVIFTGLVGCLTLVEREAREPKWTPVAQFLITAASGLLVGLGGLTRYAFGWLIIPLVVFLVLFTGSRRVILCLLALATFAAVMTPWALRTYNLSGMPFGTASYSVVEGTSAFPENRLQRSLEPDMTKVQPYVFWHKLLGNTRGILQNDLPRMGGSWITALFLTGLLIGFHNLATRRVRYFLLLCLGVLVVVQAMGRTQLSEESPEINSENLLVLLAPLVLVYGVSLFFILLDQMNLPFLELRFIVLGFFAVLASAPLLLTFLPPRPSAIAYPPYNPPAIQAVAGWLKPNELVMSDVPWAVAWYGQRQSVWLTLNAQSEFFAINDYQKPVSALYLTPQTMDSRFLTQWILAGEQSWGSFILESILKREVPPTFPLRRSPAGFMPHQLVLMDWERWRKPE